MKKFFSLFSMLSLLCILSPVNAAPPPPSAGGQVIKAGPGIHRRVPRSGYHVPPPPPPKYIGFTGWGCRGIRYYPNCYRIGWYDSFYYPDTYINIGIPIKF